MSSLRSTPTGTTSGACSFSPGRRVRLTRFARIGWNLRAVPKEKDPRLAAATAFSLIRAISVLLGVTDPQRPYIASTIWRTVSDTAARRYYFESAYNPSIFWVDLEKLKLEAGGKPLKLDLSDRPILSGETSGNSRRRSRSNFPRDDSRAREAGECDRGETARALGSLRFGEISSNWSKWSPATLAPGFRLVPTHLSRS